MADKKISALTGASTPLAGTEVLPIVQSGTTVKVSVDNLTTGKTVAAAGLNIDANSSGNAVRVTQLGSGNAIVVEDSASPDASPFAVTAAGDVGIGTAAPVTKLHISTSVNGETLRVQRVGGANLTLMRVNMDDTANTATIEVTGGAGNPALAFATVGTERIRITDAGNVGFGTIAPSYQLQLATDSAAKPSTNTWTIASDARIKTETGEYTKGLAAVCALRPVTYEYNGKAGFNVDGNENISIIAQEAVEHFPECVGTFKAKLNEDDADETELFNWNGHALTFALVNAVKELKAINDDLAARVSQLEGR